MAKDHFFSIPPELRENIYAHILHPAANRIYLDDNYISYDYRAALVLFGLNKQIYFESRKVFRDLNKFVRIETPWPEARHHVAVEGHVPMIAQGEKAAGFKEHVMAVSIDALEVPMEAGNEQGFIVLLDDLGKFTKMWFYSCLTHPRLNCRLRLTLQLRDPFTPVGEEKRISKAMQRKLLLPFGMVKDLQDVTVTGDPQPDPSVEAELRTRQRTPIPSPESCLREANGLKLEGDAELTAGRHESALSHYRNAWFAMHIVISGSQRQIHGDAFFNIQLREEPYVGKNGQSERLILRVQLVSRTCQAYLELKDYGQCAYWGMRSISMLREAILGDAMETDDIAPEDEAVIGFPAADIMGQIYYRTAVAKKELNERNEARKLLRVAAVYLPHDRLVRQEIAALALALPWPRPQ